MSGYIVYIDKPGFTTAYREAMLGVYVKYKGNVGMYPVTFLLSGSGIEMATYPERERFGLLKKMCENEDCIRIYSDPESGKKAGGVSYFLRHVTEPDENGIGRFAYVDLYSNVAEYTYRTCAPGRVTVRLSSSEFLENVGVYRDITVEEMILTAKACKKE